MDDLALMRMPTPEIARWFRSELLAAVADVTRYRRQQSTSLAKRKSELATMQDRLLNAFLAGTVDEEAYSAKSHEHLCEVAPIDEMLEQLGDVHPSNGEKAKAHIDWTQRAAEIGRGSNPMVPREIQDAVCLNRC